jgi:DNA-binding transcriptional regulator GbsR (MarR family)
MTHPEIVLQAMQQAGKAIKAGDIEKATGLSKTEVDKAMKQLKADEKIVSPVRCFWQPK